MAQSPTEVVNAFFKAMETMDYDTACQFIHDDCLYANVPAPAVKGPEGVRNALEPFFAPVLVNEWIIKRSAEQGDTVFMERLDRHQLSEDRWAELPVTGVFEVKDGKVIVWNDYFDMPTLLKSWPELAG